MPIKVRELLRKLRTDGWLEVRVKGSHHHYAHPKKPGIVTIAFDQDGDEIPNGTLNSIYKQAGWK